MISKEKIDAASSTLDDVDISNLIAVIRSSDRYKSNPAYFVDLPTKLEALDGTTEAKIINAIIDELELLGTGMAEINQAQTVGTDGVVYSQKTERDSLIDYALNVMYEEFFASSPQDSDSSIFVIKGEYGVGRLPLDYEGYI